MARAEGVSYITIGRSRRAGSLSSSIVNANPGQPATTALTALHTATIPKGSLAYIGSILRVRMIATLAANANDKVFDILLGASSIGNATPTDSETMIIIDATVTRLLLTTPTNSAIATTHITYGTAVTVAATANQLFTNTFSENLDTNLTLTLNVTAPTAATDINVRSYNAWVVLAGAPE